MAADPGNASFKWLKGEEKTRSGDVLLTFKGGARLSVRPTFNCKWCGGSGHERERDQGQDVLCRCIRSVWNAEAKAARAKWEVLGVDYKAVDEVERARVLRLEDQIAEILKEKQAIEAQAAERRARYLNVIEGQRGIVTKARDDLNAVTHRIGVLEEARVLLEQQKAEVERQLQDNHTSIIAEQNAAVRLSSSIGHELATIAESEAAAASISAGKYGERYEKLSHALKKREAELAEAQKKLAVTTPIDQEITDKTVTGKDTVDGKQSQATST